MASTSLSNEMSATPSTSANRIESRSPLQQAFTRLKRHRLAFFSALLILAWILIAALAPALAPYDPYEIFPGAARAQPSVAHPLGTDLLGRDVLSRLMFGSRTSLVVGLGAVSSYVVIGIILGALAGYFGGAVDAIVSRLIDVILSFPLIVVILTLVSITGASLRNVIFVIAILQWPRVARYVRAEFLSLREWDFVLAARAVGVHPLPIIFKHILPNAVSPIIVVATFGVANTIILEAALSFLGWGVPPPQASWGNMLMDAQKISILESMPWLWLPPGLAISITVLAFNFIGDGLRDALDPHMLHA
jgi:peptide/nickel transport system permease protein